MNSRKSASLIAASILLSGCAAPYVAPASGRAARLRVAVPQSEAFASVGVRGYASGECESPMSLGMIGGLARLGEEKGIGIPGNDKFAPGTSIERLIPAGYPYLVSMRGLYSNKECTITFRLTPARDEDYEAVYSWGNGRCEVSFNRITAFGGSDVARSKVSGVEQASTCSKGFN